MTKFINTKFGEIAIYDDVERIEVLDSDGRFFFNACTNVYDVYGSVDEAIIQISIHLSNATNLYDFSSDIEFVGTKDEMIKYLHEELNWDLPNENYNPLDNEYINRVGDYYILMKD